MDPVMAAWAEGTGDNTPQEMNMQQPATGESAELRILFQNCLFRALADGRWDGLVEIFKASGPHIVMLSEMDWLADPDAFEDGRLEVDQDAVERVRADLGMELAVSLSKTRGHVAVAWDPDYLEYIDCETTYARTDFHHGYCAPRFWAGPRLRPLLRRPLPVPFVAIATHLSPYYAPTAAGEAAILNARVHRFGGLGAIAGDINHCPVRVEGEPEIPWEELPSYNRSSRCLPRKSEDDPWVGNEIVGQTLRDGGMTDVAAHLATKPQRDGTGEVDMSMLLPTGKNGKLRVDQGHVTAALKEAITYYARVDPGENSDHFGTEFAVDLNKIDERKLREYT
jgi:hypothetical protein